MEVVLLGTSAALPTPARWPSCIAVLREGEVLLFDCGEGAQIQFQKAGLKPGKLSKIFISHLHGDHFYGLIGFLTSLQLGGRDKPMAIYGPVGLKGYLNFMQELSSFKFKYMVEVHELEMQVGEKTWEFEDYAVTAMPLDHTLFTLGFRIEEKPKPGKFDVKAAQQLGIPAGPLRARLQKGEQVVLANGAKVKPSQVLGSAQVGKTLAICFDTRPCRGSEELAREADLLIHDGTFDNSRADWANKTGHSTVSQAAEIAREAGAKKLLLTHISARYDDEDEERLLSQASSVFPNSIVGQDLMRIEV